jgi:hypothetical protein
VNHGVAERSVVVEQGQGAQPREQLVAIARFENFAERVLRLELLAGTQGRCEQMQIVIAQYRDGGRAEALHQPQHLERTRPAIDEISGDPQAIAHRIEIELREQRLELIAATLDVADGVDSHVGFLISAAAPASRA